MYIETAIRLDYILYFCDEDFYNTSKSVKCILLILKSIFTNTRLVHGRVKLGVIKVGKHADNAMQYLNAIDNAKSLFKHTNKQLEYWLSKYILNAF